MSRIGVFTPGSAVLATSLAARDIVCHGFLIYFFSTGSGQVGSAVGVHLTAYLLQHVRVVLTAGMWVLACLYGLMEASSRCRFLFPEL